jgi:phosphate transport system ATP-binding protein
MAKEMEIIMENTISNNIEKDKVLEITHKKDATIEIKGVKVWYDDFNAIKGIDMDIKPNTVTAFIGPSGCGKSTFLRLFNRMNDYIDGFRMEGKIKINGNNIYKKKVNVEVLRKEIGMVFQKPNPFPKSIFENVAYGLKIQGIKDKKFINERVEKALKTLAVEPSIILMDEPTSALDPISTAKIEDLIRDLKKKYTIIIVTHNMQQASRISDYTAFFYIGELIEYDKTKRIFTNPEKKRTENYITGRFG